MAIVQAVLDGLVYGGLYAMLGLGFYLTFSVLRRLDLSYGTVVMASVYLAAMLSTSWGLTFATPFLACAIAVPVGLFVGFVCFGLVRGDPRNSMAATLGVWMALEELVIQLPGHGKGQAIANPIHDQLLDGFLEVRLDHTLVLVLSVGAALALGLMLRATRIGLAIRTVAFDPDTAALMGMSRRAIAACATALAAAIGALGGYLFGATQQGIDVHFGMWATLKGLVILFAGGASSASRVVVAALLLSAGERVLTELAGPAFRDLAGMGLLCVVIAFTMGDAAEPRHVG